MCQTTLREYKKLLKKFIMPNVKLLDGKKIFSKSIDGFELTKKISKSLEKVALNHGSRR